ncbi:Uncharacterised protein [uncultured Flavonifractor sp.]|nr:Uncharacterised protein [uncultured Flavonifractor sp.]
MHVLYVVGSCLTKNTSANMSHNAYVQGLLENGCKVDILMAKDSWGKQDNKLPVWNEAHYFCYSASSFQDRLRILARKLVSVSEKAPASSSVVYKEQHTAALNSSWQSNLRVWLKKLFYRLFPNDPCYPLEQHWLKKAIQFSSKTTYDLVISNSSPAASHKLVWLLLQSQKLFCNRWIQIWEDPWYVDLYGSKSQTIFREEHQLLLAATEIYYVSPLTLDYQKELFPDCASKMKHIPLPYLTFSENNSIKCDFSFGYFGDYYSHTRNLLPFYQALRKSGCPGSIYGDSDLHLESTEQITVSGRVTLDVLEKVQSKTRVLVHLCNLHGGQIPGKIYHYSATNKPILFILDGTENEVEKILAYFKQFYRYEFCNNTVTDIFSAIERLKLQNERQTWEPVLSFSPKLVVQNLLL